MNLENNILNALLDIYERSKVSKGQNKVHKDIKLDITHNVFEKHRNNDDELEIALKRIERDGFAKVVNTKDGQFQCLILNLNKDSIDRLYAKLKRKNPNNVISEYVVAFEKADKTSSIVATFSQSMLSYLEAKRLSTVEQYASNPDDVYDICRAIHEMSILSEDVPERVFCAKLFSDSKRFNELRGKISKIIREFSDEPFGEDDDVIARMGVVKNTLYAFIKGELVLKINDQIIDLKKYGEALALSDESIKNMRVINSSAKHLYTIENLTSFDVFSKPDSIIIYLAGFHNTIKRQLIARIVELLPNLECYHYGDIDAGGFYILNHLREKTGIKFIPYMMGIEELRRYHNNCKPLTNNDKKRLLMMLNNDSFKDFHKTITYMLDNNIKIEQEAEC